MNLADRMKILVDRHHADLLYSLQRLFDDRLGIDVWIPVGREWWDAGYWQFGRSLGDDRLVRQYLDLNDEDYHGHTIRGFDLGGNTVWGTYMTVDPAHPDRTIYCCTLAAARDMGFDFAMPSVQENQPGYRRFADEVGARYLYHVGNTGQQIDWSLDPLVLSSSEAPIPKGRGVTISQEIDDQPGGAFAYSPGPLGESKRRTIRNFVNAFNRLPGYRELMTAEAALWEFDVTIHGHEGRDGDINPVDAMGDLMRTAGWGWHDKPVGDGFGHVIHSWAAVGRPLIGRGRYYQGKMAEPLWRHLETCVDTSQVSLPEAVQLVREISADRDRHADMCGSIRQAYDTLVDHERDAAMVAELLGLN